MPEALSRTRPDLPIAVVVGAGNMGMAIARRLGQQHRLLLADLNPTHLDTVATTLRDEGHVVEVQRCDVSDEASVAALASRTAALGRLGVLAHVVGLTPSMADWRSIMTVNLVGPALTSAAFLPLACERTAAIYIASLAAHMGGADERAMPLLDDPLAPDLLARVEAVLGGPPATTMSYMLSKTALVRMCQRQAAAWGRRQARIVSLSPGLIASHQGAMEFKNQPLKVQLLDRTPLARQGSLLEIADVVAFLASEQASFITGTDLLVDGGVSAALRHPQ
ncbi:MULTISPECIES: SDR family oxidoreductase [Burkholderia]|uniref:SDR family oxidoreductase n=1 Tax=Burkholderia TaxID=32008 RepID=UPI00158EC0D8|nr:SDR family oxidoreductase [Burkholderia seminalis]